MIMDTPQQTQRKNFDLPHLQILTNLNEAINFGFTAVNQVTRQEFFLENLNDYEIEWHIESNDFHVIPSFGRIGSNGGKQTIGIEFMPTEASAIVNLLVLNIEKEQPKTIKVSGVGKYPFLQASTKLINFEQLLVGKFATKEILLKNLSQVGSLFHIVRQQHDEKKEKAFSIDQTSGYIPPHSSFLLKVSFNPSVVGLISNVHWQIEVPGGNSVELSATGEAEGFDIRLSTYSINFGEIRIGQELSRLFTLHNLSDSPTKYQFQNIESNSNIFRFNKTRGIVKGKSHVRLLAIFEPRNTICYYQRVFCIAQNHKILALDLIGTCYDLLFKPLPLFQHQVDAFRQRVIEGRLSQVDFRYIENSLLLKISKNFQELQSEQQLLALPEHASSTSQMNSQLAQSVLVKSTLIKRQSKEESSHNNKKLLKESFANEKVLQKSSSQNSKLRPKAIKNDKSEPQKEQKRLTQVSSVHTGVSEQQQQQPQPLDLITERFEEEPPSTYSSQIQLHYEMFQGQSSNFRLIRISEDFLDFGYQDLMVLSPEKQLTIQNRLNSNVTIFWTKQNTSQEIDNNLQVFSISPETATLKPNSNAIFNIAFRPVKNAAYFFQDLQFVAYKYTEKHTKNVVDDFQKSLVSQTQRKTRDQMANTFSSVSQLFKSSKPILPVDYNADETLPPFCCQISCTGHSFGPSSMIFIPMISLEPSKTIDFKPCRVGEVSFQTVELCNNGDTPCFFRVQKDQLEVFTVFPQIGFIQPKQFALLTIQFSPKEAIVYQTSLNVILNQNSSTPLKINVHGASSQPSLFFQNNGKIFFPPSALGVSSKQKFKIENRSKIDLHFQITVPSKYSHELVFDPSSGLMRQNEHLYINCSFAPYAKKNYKIKPIFKAREVLDLSQSMVGYFLPGSGQSDDLQKLNSTYKDNLKVIEQELIVYSKGGDGSLSISPQLVDFGIVKVNFSERIVAQIKNESSCTFFLELKLVLDDESSDDDESQESPRKDAEKEEIKNEPRKSIIEEDVEKEKKKNVRELDQNVIDSNFKLDFYKGMITSNSKMDVGITFSPNKVNHFRLKLEVLATERDPNASVERKQKKIFSQKASLKIKASGNFPLLKIIDVRNDSISVASLWENFQINKINQELATDLNEHEINFLRIEQLNVQEAQNLQKQLKNYTWNFGYLPNNQAVKPRKIVATIQNVGGTELDFEFKLPSDSQIDVEPWADPGELQGDEAIEKAIVDRKIFQIIPKSGTLKPQQFPGNIDDGFQMLAQKSVKVQSENHLLRVVLQINNGKPLVISLKGMTLSPTQGMLSVKQNKVTLPDCPIGMILPLKYPIEIQNVGLTKLNYNIEVQEIDSEGSNIDSQFQIFNISNKSGSLMPHEKEYLYCQFKPLEAKQYYHTLTIKATDFMKPLQDIKLNVVGQGYSKPPKKAIKMQENEYPQQRSSVSSIGSKVFFSIEEIDFGKLSPGESIHRVIILYNLSTDQKLTFDFTKGFSIQSKAPGLVCDDKFTIEPNQGKLEPGEFIELKLTLVQAPSPSIYQGEVECSILWGNHGLDNRIVTSMTSASGQSSVNEKETLFLRIKKESKLDAKYLLPLEAFKPTQVQEHLMISVIGQAIQEILNDDNVFQILKRLNNQPVQVFRALDGEEPANINSISKGIEDVLEANEPEEGILNDSNLEMQDYGGEEGENAEQQSFQGKLRPRKSKDESDFRYQFMNPEFLDLLDLIMENTYFNIVQEATRKECDLLRTSKTFVQPSSLK